MNGHLRFKPGVAVVPAEGAPRAGHREHARPHRRCSPGERPEWRRARSGVYGHVTAAMRNVLTGALQERWEESLRARARLAPGSIVPVLDALLLARREQPTKFGSHLTPRIGHEPTARLAPKQMSGR